AALQRLVGGPGARGRRRARVVILGGHARDESKLGERLFEASPFEVRWRLFEKRSSSGAIQKEGAPALCHPGAALINTGMASHTLVQFAKEYAQRHGILWRCIEKATDRQLRAALLDLFPETAAGWG